MTSQTIVQLLVFLGLNAAVAVITWLHCRKASRATDDTREYFLASSGLNWAFIAGSITLTNINTDTFVGMNGPQTLIMVLWELSGFVGLLLLAKIFVPLYYKYDCTTVTELLERRYHNKNIRATVSAIFLLGDVLIFLPIMLYTSSLLIKTMFGLDTPLIVLACGVAAVGAAYAIGGGLRAVAISDTYTGVVVLGMAMLVTVLSLNAVHWDFSGIPAERLTLVGGPNSAIPWPALLTGMIFSQLYYWSTNQTITQRALAAPSIREAKKGVYAAAAVRLLIIPPIVVLPGLCAYKLYGRLEHDAAYGHIVGQLLPHWLLGAFAAAMFGAVMTSYNATLNSSAALYVCDLHQKYINPAVNVRRVSTWLQVGFALFSIAMVPAYAQSQGIMQLIQSLIGLFSMPILSAFIIGLLFRNVDARAVIATIVFGACFYALFAFGWPAWHERNPAIPAPWHFLHSMALTVWTCIGFALTVNRLVFKQRAAFELGTREAWRGVLATLKA
ncbi:MAG TPA: sodium/solute symporter [Opitutaceae bacterium]|nr:sodium/solute symporter [Opitutaceae bacterium]